MVQRSQGIFSVFSALLHNELCQKQITFREQHWLAKSSFSYLYPPSKVQATVSPKSLIYICDGNLGTYLLPLRGWIWLGSYQVLFSILKETWNKFYS